ncbi:MAG: KpsF/GutQ family sugar-phosphate isomerase [Elusimicrobiota bacterium]
MKPAKAIDQDSISDETLIQEGRRVLLMEAEALKDMQAHLGADFCRAVRAVGTCRGKVVTAGVGKSGFIARKLASTLASLGRPSFFVHPTEAVHGDLGALGPQDILIAVSHSGNTNELVSFIAAARNHQKVPVIALVGDACGTLASQADIVLTTGVREEACHLGLAPTSSSTAALALGDALAVSVSRFLGVEARDFALLHPSGSLGERLYAPVKDIMRAKFPRADAARTLRELAPLITAGGLGFVVAEDAASGRIGVVTDGDIRRAVQKGEGNMDKRAADVMSTPPKSVQANALGMDALMIMEKARITSLVVLDDAGRLAGVLHLHDILRFGLGLPSA